MSPYRYLFVFCWWRERETPGDNCHQICFVGINGNYKVRLLRTAKMESQEYMKMLPLKRYGGLKLGDRIDPKDIMTWMLKGNEFCKIGDCPTQK
jgi:hypothetical protein